MKIARAARQGAVRALRPLVPQARALCTPVTLGSARMPPRCQPAPLSAFLGRASRSFSSSTGPVDISSLKYCALNDDGLLSQPSNPKFKLALVSTYVPNQKNGGSDKMLNGHRFDSIPMANGVIKQGMSCQIVFYNHDEHDKFFEVMKQFDGILIRANPVSEVK